MSKWVLLLFAFLLFTAGVLLAILFTSDSRKTVTDFPTALITDTNYPTVPIMDIQATEVVEEIGGYSINESLLDELAESMASTSSDQTIIESYRDSGAKISFFSVSDFESAKTPMVASEGNARIYGVSVNSGNTNQIVGVVYILDSDLNDKVKLQKRLSQGTQTILAQYFLLAGGVDESALEDLFESPGFSKYEKIVVLN